MTTIYDPTVSAEPGQTPPYTPWPGSAGPGGPGGPPGYGGWGGGPGRPGRRFRHPVMLAVTALVFGLGSFFLVKTTGIAAGNTVLTTAQIEAKTDPGLVDVNTTLGLQGAAAAGTGQVLTSNGEVLTNNHVVEGATSIRVTDIGNGRTYTAKVVGYDQTKDIAVIQLQGASGLQTTDMGNSSTAAVGQKVVALGNAGGKGGTPSVAVGHITGLNASITASDEGSGTSEHLNGLIHHNAPIQPGDSGGPLVNTSGQVIAIDTAASSGYQFQTGQTQSGKTQAFAIPINEALALANQIEAGNASSTVHIGATGLLGVEVQSASSAASNGVQTGSGAVIAGVLSNTPAANAGLAQGDVITSVNGQRVTSPSGLQAALELHHPGDRVTIGWTDQAGQTQSASVTLVNGPAA
jgi:S1-C subfamily serine protease